MSSMPFAIAPNPSGPVGTVISPFSYPILRPTQHRSPYEVIQHLLVDGRDDGRCTRPENLEECTVLLRLDQVGHDDFSLRHLELVG